MKSFKSYIVEAFDKPYPVNLRKEYGEYRDRIKLDDGTQLEITFEDTGGREFEVYFSRTRKNDSLSTFDATGEGDQQRVMATVLDAMKKFIEKARPMALFFSAEKKGAKGNQLGSREKLYTRLVTKMARKHGYKPEIKHGIGGTIIWLRREL